MSVHKRGARWKTVRLNTIGRMEIDGSALQDWKLVDVTPDMLGRWHNHRLTVDKVKDSTVNRDLNLLSDVFHTVAKEWRLCSRMCPRSLSRIRSTTWLTSSTSACRRDNRMTSSATKSPPDRQNQW